MKDLSVFVFDFADIVYIIFLILLYAALVVWGGFVWALLLKSLGGSVSRMKMVLIYSLTQFAKYLPGNVMHHLGRVGMAKQYGVEISRVTSSLGLEILLSVCVSGLCAVSFIFYAGRVDEYLSLLKFSGGMLLLLTLVFILLACLFWKYALPIIVERFSIVDIPTASALVRIAFFYFLSFSAMGLLNSLLATWVFDAPFINPLLMTGAFSLAWVVGFVTPGAPGGLGVREAMMLATLGPLLGAEVTVGLSVVLRVVTTLGDGLVFSVAWIYLYCNKKQEFSNE